MLLMVRCRPWWSASMSPRARPPAVAMTCSVVNAKSLMVPRMRRSAVLATATCRGSRSPSVSDGADGRPAPGGCGRAGGSHGPRPAAAGLLQQRGRGRGAEQCRRRPGGGGGAERGAARVPAGVLGLDRPDLGTRLACSARFPGPGRVRDDPDAAGARRFGGGIGGLLRRIDRPTYGADEELFAGLFAARAPVRPCPLRGSTPSRPPSPAR